MKRKFHLLFFIIILINSCSNLNKNDDFTKIFTSSNKLTSQKVIYNQDQIAEPLSMFFHKEKLYILDFYSNTFISIIDLVNVNNVYHIGRKGRGPGEIQHPTSLLNNESMNKLELYDADGVHLFFFDLDSAVNFIDYIPHSISFQKNSQNPYKLISLNNSFFLGSGSYGEKRFAIYKKDSLFKKTTNYPKNYEVANHKSLMSLIFQSDFIKSTNGKYMVSTISTGQILDFFKVSDDSILTLKNYNFGNPVVIDVSKEGFESVATLPTNIYGVVSLAATQEYLYALYSGRSSSKFKEYAYYGNKVLVFNWDGSPVKLLKLDKDIKVIAVSPDNLCLYGFGGKYGIDLLRFRLE